MRRDLVLPEKTGEIDYKISPWGSRPYATRVIAAYNSIATDADRADYVCTGEDDHLIFNAAIEELSGYGGRIELLEGNFYIKPDEVTITNRITLSGQGEATIITGDEGESGNIFTMSNAIVRDMTIAVGWSALDIQRPMDGSGQVIDVLLIGGPET